MLRRSICAVRTVLSAPTFRLSQSLTSCPSRVTPPSLSRLHWIPFMGATQSLSTKPPANVDPELQKRAEEDPKSLSDDDWRKLLSPMEYHVTREHGTERAFTGELTDNKEKGVYLCTCCRTELFSSDTKFESGSGWPSFFDTIKKGSNTDEDDVDRKRDFSLGMSRVEVTCKRCGAHLGHVFDDGPDDTTGLRYCINSASLKFKKRDKK